MKRFLFLCALCANILMAQATVYNGNCGAGGTDGDNITWSLNTDDSTLVLTGSGTMANYHYSTNPAPWYQYRSFVKTLTLGEGITNIGEYAFYYLQETTTLNIPTTIETIESFAFYWCTGMQNVNFATPSALTEIKERAFAGNGFTSITLPEGLTTIGSYAFCDCHNVLTINLPSTLTTIATYAFRQSRKLVLTVPSTVTSIGGNAFQWLSNVFYDGQATGSPWGAKAINGYEDGWFVFESTAKAKLCACSVDAYGEIIIPESVTEIGDWAFAYANKITLVALPSHLTKIGQYAFDNCSKMEMFASWPSTLTSIGNYAFRSCSAFTSFTMPTGVTQLSTDLLEWCSNITWVHLHSGVKSVGYEAFYGCKNLKTITCEALQPPTMPSSTSGDPFKSDSIDKITLRVPCESKELYQTAAYWKTLGTIQGYDAPTMTLQTSNAAWGTAEVTAQDCYNVTIMATPTDGYFFAQWNDGNQYNPRRLTLNGDSSLTAIFTDMEPPCYDTESEFSVIAEGSSYTWNSETYTQSGDYQQIFTIEGGCDSVVTLHLTIPWQNGVLPGVFSIAENKQVKFSQGALQFNAAQGTHTTADGSAQGTWRFADNQYYTVSEGNKHISSTYDGWFDLFGWGTSGYDNTENDPLAVNYQPWSVVYNYIEEDDGNEFGYGPSLHMTDSDLVGTSANYDWGVYNAISNGGNQPGLWRTLSWAEWEYVLYGRQNASNLYAQATVAGVKGIVILPDDGITSANFTPTTADWTTNKYSAAEWVALENQGAVFFPAMGGYRYSSNNPLIDEGIYGPYWTTTCAYRRAANTCGGSTYARAVYWGSGSSDGGCYYSGHFDLVRSRARGYRVRLVQDIVEEVTPVGAMTWRADDEDIKDFGTIAENTTVRGLTFVATADKAITVDESKKTYDTITFTHRIKLNGTIGANYRHLKFDVTGDATIEIYAMASSSSATRQLNIAAGAYNANLRQFDVTGDAVNYVKYDYTGAPTTIYLGSANSGINILGIVLTPRDTPTAIDNTPFPSGEGRGEASKFLINGQVFILRDGKYYTILGVPANPLTPERPSAFGRSGLRLERQ